MWLVGTPDCDQMAELLQSPEFRQKIRQYIQVNIRAHLDDLNETDIKTMPKEPQLAYSRPLDPEANNWQAASHELERRLVRSQQLHTCSRATRLRIKDGQLSCKCRAPWPLCAKDFVDLKVAIGGPNGAMGTSTIIAPLCLQACVATTTSN